MKEPERVQLHCKCSENKSRIGARRAQAATPAGEGADKIDRQGRKSGRQAQARPAAHSERRTTPLGLVGVRKARRVSPASPRQERSNIAPSSCAIRSASSHGDEDKEARQDMKPAEPRSRQQRSESHRRRSAAGRALRAQEARSTSSRPTSGFTLDESRHEAPPCRATLETGRSPVEARSA
jgi:hypothetical protein